MAVEILKPVSPAGYLYNVTMQVNKQMENQYMEWLQQLYIPEVMDSGFFTKYQLLKIISDAPEDTTYAVQFITPSIEKFQEFENQFLDRMLGFIVEIWNNEVLYFTTSMEIVK